MAVPGSKLTRKNLSAYALYMGYDISQEQATLIWSLIADERSEALQFIAARTAFKLVAVTRAERA